MYIVGVVYVCSVFNGMEERGYVLQLFIHVNLNKEGRQHLQRVEIVLGDH